MAHLSKFGRSALGNMFNHYEHKKARDNVDQSKTHLNYNLAKDIQPLRPNDFIDTRLSLGVKVLKRKDVNYMCDWIITLPKDVKPEDQERFFKSCFDFLCKRYGKDNVISCWVHLDETTPHMHFSYIPICINKGKDNHDYPEKLSAKEVNNRRDLQTFHLDLNRHISRVLGYEVQILNNETKEGNKTITQLKRQTELQKQKECIEQTKKVLSTCNLRTKEAIKELNGIIDQIRGYKALKGELQNKIEDLQAIHNDTMEQIQDMASKYGLYQDLLQRNILSGNYKDVEELRNDIIDAQEAQEIIDFFGGVGIYQNDDPSL